MNLQIRFCLASQRKNSKYQQEKDGIFVIKSDNENSIRAKKVILAVGHYDVYPNIPGFLE